MRIVAKDGTITYPTFTQVPPSRPLSMIMALTPYFDEAHRAAPSPPLPPPMTRKSVSLEMGAMVKRVEAKCRERVTSRPGAVFVVEGMTERRTRTANGCMGWVRNKGWRRGRGVRLEVICTCTRRRAGSEAGFGKCTTTNRQAGGGGGGWS